MFRHHFQHHRHPNHQRHPLLMSRPIYPLLSQHTLLPPTQAMFLLRCRSQHQLLTHRLVDRRLSRLCYHLRYPHGYHRHRHHMHQVICRVPYLLLSQHLTRPIFPLLYQVSNHPWYPSRCQLLSPLHYHSLYRRHFLLFSRLGCRLLPHHHNQLISQLSFLRKFRLHSQLINPHFFLFLLLVSTHL